MDTFGRHVAHFGVPKRIARSGIIGRPDHAVRGGKGRIGNLTGNVMEAVLKTERKLIEQNAELGIHIS